MRLARDLKRDFRLAAGASKETSRNLKKGRRERHKVPGKVERRGEGEGEGEGGAGEGGPQVLDFDTEDL